MSPETIREAIAEAERFIKKAKAVEIFHRVTNDGRKYDALSYQSAEKASCKRASLDLTKALARMRATR